MKNINHTQLTTDTGYEAIHYSNPGVSIASSLVQQNQLAASRNLHNKLCMSFWMETEGIVFLHCSHFYNCTKNPLKVTVISTAALKNSFCSHYLWVFLAVLLCKILGSRWVFKSDHREQNMCWFFIHPVLSRVHSFDRRVTCEKWKSLVFSGLF